MKYLAIILLILQFNTSLAEPSLLIKSVRILNNEMNKPTEPLDIEIIDGTIYRIGKNLKTELTNIIDGSGQFVMPGLIDCHVHLRTVTGALFRNETKESIKEQQDLHLNSYLAAGVTTVLDAAPPENLYAEINQLKKSRVIPQVIYLAPFLTPKGGYFGLNSHRHPFYNDLWPPIEDLSQIVKYIKSARKMNPLGVKVTVENGMGPFKVFPLFEKKFQEEILRSAKANNSPIFVHSYSEEEYEEALKYEPYAFVHLGFNEKQPSNKLLKKIKDSKAYVVSTSAIYKMMLLVWDQEIFDDPWFKRLVPEKQIKTARNQKINKKLLKIMAKKNKPAWLPGFLAGALSGMFINKAEITKQLNSAKKATLKMYNAGIPIIMGADAGNWPAFTTFFHGVGSILEMDALVESGLPINEVLKSATINAATMLKISDKFGSVKPGQTADLLLLPENPLDNIKALRNIKFVIKSGIVKTPQEWMDQK